MNGRTPGHGTTELLEVAYRFGLAVVSLATSTEAPRGRLVEAWRELTNAEGALSGLWPEPHLSAELADQVRDLLHDLTAAGSIEATVAALDDRAVARMGQRISAMAFALHQAVGAAERRAG